MCHLGGWVEYWEGDQMVIIYHPLFIHKVSQKRLDPCLNVHNYFRNLSKNEWEKCTEDGKPLWKLVNWVGSMFRRGAINFKIIFLSHFGAYLYSIWEGSCRKQISSNLSLFHVLIIGLEFEFVVVTIWALFWPFQNEIHLPGVE